METWGKPRDFPSFSSSLLDQIYRSIDDSPAAGKKKNHHHHRRHHRTASLLDDRQSSPEKLVFGRRSIAADFERSRRITTPATATTAADSVFLRYSNSSSSDLSGFSSSSSDSFYVRSKSSASPPKPIRTSVDNSGVQKPSSKQELGGFLRTKSKALKIYADLKKVKQPISPGGRLATFLNSLFTNAASNHKKPKKVSTATEPRPSAISSSSTSTTACSSASSFSRSCLSKTPSSSGKSKRSVRFCPVNVILDEDSSVHIPYGYNNHNDSKRHRRVMMEEEENRRVIQAAKDLIKTYHKNKNHLTTATKNNNIINVEEEDDDDDAASYASSDLFELENLSAIGIDRYQEELPVYETTRLDNTNRPIATTL